MKKLLLSLRVRVENEVLIFRYFRNKYDLSAPPLQGRLGGVVKQIDLQIFKNT
jgi:hypothetical protein